MALVSLYGTEFLYQDLESKTHGFMRQAQILSRAVATKFRTAENTVEKEN
ncbi:hypothetical protein [Candidatus Pantoea floridensis]|nr:hypothetical protein [Pantoea floridensis]